MSRHLFLFLAAMTAAAQNPAPQLTISANGGQSIDLPRGWPLVVGVAILHSQRFVTSPPPRHLSLAPIGGSWYDGVGWHVTSNGADVTPWPIVMAQKPDEASLDLAPNAMFNGIWQMSSADSNALSSGSYQVRARLQINDGTGWTGVVESAPVTVNVVDPPADADLTPDQRAQGAILQARYAINAGDSVTATTTLDAVLTTQPANADALQLRALLAEQAGQFDLALAFAYGALDSLPAVAADPLSRQEPPEFLIHLVDRLRAEAGAAAAPASVRRKR